MASHPRLTDDAAHQQPKGQLAGIISPSLQPKLPFGAAAFARPGRIRSLPPADLTAAIVRDGRGVAEGAGASFGEAVVADAPVAEAGVRADAQMAVLEQGADDVARHVRLAPESADGEGLDDAVVGDVAPGSVAGVHGDRRDGGEVLPTAAPAAGERPGIVDERVEVLVGPDFQGTDPQEAFVYQAAPSGRSPVQRGEGESVSAVFHGTRPAVISLTAVAFAFGIGIPQPFGIPLAVEFPILYLIQPALAGLARRVMVVKQVLDADGRHVVEAPASVTESDDAALGQMLHDQQAELGGEERQGRFRSMVAFFFFQRWGVQSWLLQDAARCYWWRGELLPYPGEAENGQRQCVCEQAEQPLTAVEVVEGVSFLQILAWTLFGNSTQRLRVA